MLNGYSDLRIFYISKYCMIKLFSVMYICDIDGILGLLLICTVFYQCLRMCMYERLGSAKYCKV